MLGGGFKDNEYAFSVGYNKHDGGYIKKKFADPLECKNAIGCIA